MSSSSTFDRDLMVQARILDNPEMPLDIAMHHCNPECYSGNQLMCPVNQWLNGANLFEIRDGYDIADYADDNVNVIVAVNVDQNPLPQAVDLEEVMINLGSDTEDEDDDDDGDDNDDDNELPGMTMFVNNFEWMTKEIDEEIFYTQARVNSNCYQIKWMIEDICTYRFRCERIPTGTVDRETESGHNIQV